jgi:hypothetical protein
LDVELWALVLDHVDRLALPVVPFVCRTLRDAVRHRRSIYPRPPSDLPTKPAFVQQHDFVDALIEARLLHMVRWAVDIAGCEMPQGLCRKIAATGDLGLLQWARVEKRRPWGGRDCSVAASTGNLEMIKWARDDGCPWCWKTVSTIAFRFGFADVLAWCYAEGLPSCPRPQEGPYNAESVECIEVAAAHGYEPTPYAGTVAAGVGHIAVLDWLRRHGHTYNADHCGTAASARDNGAALRWLVGIGCPYDAYTISTLALRGNLEAIKWIHGLGCPISAQACANAASRGHLDVIEWLNANGCPWAASVCVNAALGGHLDVIRWAKKRGHPWRDGICDAAALRAHLNVLAWAHGKHGCPWSQESKAKACKRAASRGDVALIEWLLERGCLIGPKTIRRAAEGGWLDVLKCIDIRGHDWTREEGAYEAAAWGDHMNVLLWLRGRGAPLSGDGVPYAATRTGNMDMLRWAVDNGCALTSALCSSAAAEGHLTMLMWLRGRGCPWGPDTCSMGVQHLGVLCWARAQGCPWDCLVWEGAESADPEVIEWIRSCDDAPPPFDPTAEHPPLPNVPAQPDWTVAPRPYS